MVHFCTFVVSIIVLLGVRIPRQESSAESKEARGSLLTDAAFGWRYIKQRVGLFHLLTNLSVLNFIGTFLNVLLTPLVLTIAAERGLSLMLSLSGIGMLLGSVLMSAWGGLRRRVLGIV